MKKMLDRNKTDSDMGHKVEEYLKQCGVATPSTGCQMEEEAKKDVIENCFAAIMEAMCLDLDDDSLKGTPQRMAKMYVNELFWGLDPNNFPKCTAVENKFNYDEFVIEKDIKVNSSCEHHFVTIYGKAVVAYKPHTKVIGLSKMNRIVEYFSRRPQVQERLTEQIWYALSYILQTEDIAVIIDAEHFCVKTRGVEDINSSTVTSKLGGVFKKPESRAELMALMK